MSWRWAWTLACAGCWSPNPAFLTGTDGAATTDAQGSASTGEPDGTGLSPGTGSTGASPTSGGTSAAPTTATATTDATSEAPGTTDATTGDATGSTGAVASTGEPDPVEVCAAGEEVKLLRDLADGICGADVAWSFSMQGQDPIQAVPKCPSEGTHPVRIKLVDAEEAMNGEMFEHVLMLAPPRAKQSGLVQGEYRGIALDGAYPCVRARVACAKDNETCSLTWQVFVKPKGAGEYTDSPLVGEVLADDGVAELHASLAAYQGEEVDLLLLVFNDDRRPPDAGEPHELTLWERPRVVEVAPP